MLQMLFKDLFEEELAHPNEVARTVIAHIPEVEVRSDTRRYLEFVVNGYNLNPSPKVVLIVEGRSEELFVNRLCEEHFGFPIGRVAIEVVNIRGVGNATGNRKDGSQAIVRLVDYLHHHQTLVFLVLDNENDAFLLRRAWRDAISLFGVRKRVTRPEYMRVWKRSFEFDNFSDTEIGTALTQVGPARVKFSAGEVASCRKSARPGAALETLFRSRVGNKLPKQKLVLSLIEIALQTKSRKKIENRPITILMKRIVESATRNPFPVTHEVWRSNQRSKRIARKS